MRRANRILFLVVMSVVVPLRGQPNARVGCVPNMEYLPTLVANPEQVVSFHCNDATPLDLIHAAAYQTRVPMGVMLGRDPSRLARARRSYNLDRVSVREALREAIQGTGYVVEEDGEVLVLMAGDVTERQKGLLHHVLTGFKPGLGETMAGLSFLLTAWVRALSASHQGTAASILESTNEEGFTVTFPQQATVEEVANLIVRHGHRGMWVFHATPSALRKGSLDEMVIESYQHYSNAPR